MDNGIPEINELIQQFSKLPGLGPKSAKRIILKLINNKEIEGILLYADAEGSKHLDEDYRWRKYNISFKSINLNQNWQSIHGDLLNILNH